MRKETLPHFSYLSVREILFYEIHLFHLETLSVEIGKAACIGGKSKCKLVGVQRLVIPVKALIQLAVFAVTQQRMSRMGKLGANLVSPACNQLALHKGQAVSACQCNIIGLAGFCAGLGCIRNEYPIFLGILEKVSL